MLSNDEAAGEFVAAALSPDDGTLLWQQRFPGFSFAAPVLPPMLSPLAQPTDYGWTRRRHRTSFTGEGCAPDGQVPVGTSHPHGQSHRLEPGPPKVARRAQSVSAAAFKPTGPGPADTGAPARCPSISQRLRREHIAGEPRRGLGRELHLARPSPLNGVRPLQYRRIPLFGRTPSRLVLNVGSADATFASTVSTGHLGRGDSRLLAGNKRGGSSVYVCEW